MPTASQIIAQMNSMISRRDGSVAEESTLVSLPPRSPAGSRSPSATGGGAAGGFSAEAKARASALL